MRKNRSQLFTIFIDYSEISKKDERFKKIEEVYAWLYDSFGGPGFYMDGARWSGRVSGGSIFYHFKNNEDAVLFKLIWG